MQRPRQGVARQPLALAMFHHQARLFVREDGKTARPAIGTLIVQQHGGPDQRQIKLQDKHSRREDFPDLDAAKHPTAIRKGDPSVHDRPLTLPGPWK